MEKRMKYEEEKKKLAKTEKALDQQLAMECKKRRGKEAEERLEKK
jgi:hypothetical protein